MTKPADGVREEMGRIDGFPHLRQYWKVKTTIDIPDPLYRQAKIRAVEQSTSLKEILLRGLERELRAGSGHPEDPAPPLPYFARRKLLPAFARLQAAGAFRPKPGDRDITDLISDDREGR